jgi:hypothetical protein
MIGAGALVAFGALQPHSSSTSGDFNGPVHLSSQQRHEAEQLLPVVLAEAAGTVNKNSRPLGDVMLEENGRKAPKSGAEKAQEAYNKDAEENEAKYYAEANLTAMRTAKSDKPDLRKNIYQVGIAAESAMEDIHRELLGTTSEFNKTFGTKVHELDMYIRERTRFIFGGAAKVKLIANGLRSSADEIDEDLKMTEDTRETLAVESEVNRDRLLDYYEYAALPPIKAFFVSMQMFLRNFEKYKKQRSTMIEMKQNTRDRSMRQVSFRVKDLNKEEKAAVESAGEQEAFRRSDSIEKWELLTNRAVHFVHAANDIYKTIDERFMKQERRANRRTVSRMNLMALLSKELEATGKLMLEGVKETDRQKNTDLKFSYATTMQDMETIAETLLKDYEIMIKNLQQSVKTQNRNMDTSNAHVTGIQSKTTDAVTHASGVLQSIRDEFADTHKSLTLFMDNAREGTAEQTRAALETTHHATEAMVQDITNSATSAMQHVKNQADAYMAKKHTSLSESNIKLQGTAHELTLDAEHDADVAEAGFKAAERGDLRALQNAIEEMKKRLDKAYFKRDLDTDELFEKIDKQSDGFYDGVEQQKEKALFDLSMQDAGGHGGATLASIKEAGEDEASDLHSMGKTQKDELLKLQGEFDEAAVQHSKNVGAKAANMAKESYKKVFQAEEAAEKTGVLVNQLLPALKEAAVNKATAEMGKISDVETHLKDHTKQAVVAAANGEKFGTQPMVNEAAELGAHLSKEYVGTHQYLEDALAGTAQQVEDRVNGFAHEHHIRDVATSAELNAARNLRHDITSKANQLSQSMKAQEQGRKAVEGGKKDVQKSIDGVRSRMSTAITADAASGSESLDVTTTEANSNLNTAEHATEKDVVEARNAAQTESYAAAQTYTVKVDAAQTAFRRLLSHINGFAADAEEWNQGLTSAIQGAKGLAHREAIASSQGVAETQAAIDTRFRELAQQAQQKVEGLSADANAHMATVVANAKSMTESIAHDATLSAEEKRQKLASIDAWMVEELQRTKDLGNRSHDEVAEAEQADAEFLGQAQSRAERLMRALKADRTADHVQGTLTNNAGVSIEDLIADADRKAQTILVPIQQKFDAMKPGHEAESTHLKTKAQADLRNAEGAIHAAVALKAAAEESAHKFAAALPERLGTAENDLVDLSSQVSTAGLAKKIGALQTDREDRMDFMRQWVTGFHTTSAETLEQMTKLIAHLPEQSSDYFHATQADIAEFASKMAAVLESDQMRTLAKIGQTDKGVDDIIAKDSVALNRTEDFDSETKHYRGKVVTALQAVADEMQKDLKEARSNEDRLRKAMDSGAKSTTATADAAMAKVLSSQEKAADAEETRLRLEVHNLQAEIADGRKRSAEDLAVVSKEADSSATAAEEAEANALAPDVSVQSGGVVEDFAKQLTGLIGAKQEALDDARAQLERRAAVAEAAMAGSGGVPTSTLELGTLEHARLVHEQAEYRALLAAHGTLAAKAERLAAEAREAGV